MSLNFAALCEYHIAKALMNCRYYLADEPGGNKVDPKLLEKAYNFVKV